MMKLTRGTNTELPKYINVEINGFEVAYIYCDGEIDILSKQKGIYGFSLIEMKQFINIMENFNLFYDNLKH